MLSESHYYYKNFFTLYKYTNCVIIFFEIKIIDKHFFFSFCIIYLILKYLKGILSSFHSKLISKFHKKKKNVVDITIAVDIILNR